MPIPVFVRLRPIVQAGRNNIVPLVRDLVLPKKPFKRPFAPQRRPIPQSGTRRPRPRSTGAAERTPRRRSPGETGTRRPRPRPGNAPERTPRRRPPSEPIIRRPQPQRPPAQPPTDPLRPALEASRQINERLTQVNRGLADFVFPGLNELTDFLVDKTLKEIQKLVDLGKKQKSRPTKQPDEPIIEPLPDSPYEPEFRANIPNSEFPQLPGQTYPPGSPPPANTPLTRITIKYGYNRSQLAITYNALEGLRTSESTWISRDANNPTVWTFYTYGIPKLGVKTTTSPWQPVGGGTSFNMIGASSSTYIEFEGWQQTTQGQPIYNKYTTGVTVQDIVSVAPNGSPYAYAGSASSSSLIVHDIDILSPTPLPDEEPETNPQEIIIIYPPEEEEEDVPCDLSPLQSILRAQQQQLANLQLAVNEANLGINANIDALKPPIANTNAVVQTTQTVVNSTFSTVSSTASKVDDLAVGLNNVTGTVNTTASRIQTISSQVDDVLTSNNLIRNGIDGIGNNLNNIGQRVGDIWNRTNEIFEKMVERFDRLAKWLRLPQLLSALTLIVTLHNAAMLSGNLIQSLGEVIDIGLNIIGRKDENDQEFNVSEVLGQSANSLASTILGEANWNSTKEAWKKISNIYRAASNCIYSIQSICDSMISIMQVGAECTGKIGNALRRAGVVAENAYNWLPEQINLAIANQTAFRGVLNNLRNLNDTADSLQTATAETRNIQTEYAEFLQKKQKFDQEIDNAISGKSNSESTSKSVSQSPTISTDDLRS